MDQGWAFKSPTEILVDQMQTLVEVCRLLGEGAANPWGSPREATFFETKKVPSFILIVGTGRLTSTT